MSAAAPDRAPRAFARLPVSWHSPRGSGAARSGRRSKFHLDEDDPSPGRARSGRSRRGPPRTFRSTTLKPAQRAERLRDPLAAARRALAPLAVRPSHIHVPPSLKEPPRSASCTNRRSRTGRKLLRWIGHGPWSRSGIQVLRRAVALVAARIRTAGSARRPPFMSASRVTLATIGRGRDRLALARRRRRPPRRRCRRQIRSSGRRREGPGVQAPGPPATRRIASSVAMRMLNASTSATLATPTPPPPPSARMRTDAFPLARGACVLESRTPRILVPGQEPRTRPRPGPASGPRPASSIPARRSPQRARYVVVEAGRAA